MNATTASVAEVPVIAVTGNKYADYAGSVVAVAFSVVGALLWLRRKTSRDSTEIAKDRAETSLLQTALSRAQAAEGDAREAWQQRAKDAREIGELRGENARLRSDVEDLKRTVGELTSKIEELRAAARHFHPILGTGNTDLQPAT